MNLINLILYTLEGDFAGRNYFRVAPLGPRPSRIAGRPARRESQFIRWDRCIVIRPRPRRNYRINELRSRLFAQPKIVVPFAAVAWVDVAPRTIPRVPSVASGIRPSFAVSCAAAAASLAVWSTSGASATARAAAAAFLAVWSTADPPAR